MCNMFDEQRRRGILPSVLADKVAHSVGVFRLEVADSGAGIEEEDQKKVFGEFAQFNRNELQGGGASS